MTAEDQARGRAIGASLAFMRLLQDYQGPTSDWPIVIYCDDPQVTREFYRLRGELVDALNALKDV
jgi:hypothetical protein